MGPGRLPLQLTQQVRQPRNSCSVHHRTLDRITVVVVDEVMVVRVPRVVAVVVARAGMQASIQ